MVKNYLDKPSIVKSFFKNKSPQEEIQKSQTFKSSKKQISRIINSQNVANLDYDLNQNNISKHFATFESALQHPDFKKSQNVASLFNQRDSEFEKLANTELKNEDNIINFGISRNDLLGKHSDLSFQDHISESHKFQMSNYKLHILKPFVDQQDLNQNKFKKKGKLNSEKKVE